jgi:hypothetical protein
MRGKRALALLAAGGLATLAWPGPTGADTSLGGYSGVAQAEAIRIQIYEPLIPIPSDPGQPQVDGGIAYSKSSTETGPVSRGTASYLWPGDVLGDGWEQLTGKPGTSYPVQVNSRFPATSSAPANNTAQISDGNGMTTSSDGFSTSGTVEGVGIAGVNLLSNPLEGLCNILINKNCPSGSSSSVPNPVPVTVSTTLAALVSLSEVGSQSVVKIGDKSVTSTAHTHASEIKLLAGLVTLSGLDVTSQTVTDGTKATTSGTTVLTGLKVAGQPIAVGDKGTPPPVDHVDLSQIGLEVQFDQSQRSATGATGSYAAQGLILTLDTAALKHALLLDDVTTALGKFLAKIPKYGDGLAQLLDIGPKIVIRIGDVSSSANASPAYVGPPITGGTGGGGSVAGGGSTGTTGGVTTGQTGSGTPIGSGTSTTPTGSSTTVQPVAYSLPGLGTVPRLLILAGLVLAGLLGWLFRAAGALLLGGGGMCAFGLKTGVPDLRKG